MKCVNCNTELNSGQNFCKGCGAKLYNNQNNGQLSQSTSNNIQQNDFNVIVDDDLINAYMGENYESFNNQGFSICIFFFGWIYSFYRKMWLLGLCWLLGLIIVNSFLSDISKILIIASNIIISTQFKKIYLMHAIDQVKKIKMLNTNKSQEELSIICRKKGGTTIVPIIIVVILFVILLFLNRWS